MPITPATFWRPASFSVADGEALVESEPLGVLFCVEPWNFPYYQLARVAGPDLMAGNVLIVKHAPNVPQCALAFEKLLQEAGAPEGVYTNVFLSNAAGREGGCESPNQRRRTHGQREGGFGGCRGSRPGFEENNHGTRRQ